VNPQGILKRPDRDDRPLAQPPFEERPLAKIPSVFPVHGDSVPKKANDHKENKAEHLGDAEDEMPVGNLLEHMHE
jgi:hypothetical protein